MGVRGQKCLISGNHMVRTWRRELGLAREKHSTTTSDLEEKEGERKVLQHHRRWEEGRHRRADLLCRGQDMSAEETFGLWLSEGDREEKKKKGVGTESQTSCQFMFKRVWYVYGGSLFNSCKALWEHGQCHRKSWGRKTLVCACVCACVWASGLVICVAHLSLSLLRKPP